MFKKQTSEKIIKWVRTNNFEQLGAYLVSGSVHGKPGVPVAELNRIATILQQELSDEEQYKIAKKLLKRKEYTCRNLGTQFIVSGWPQHADVEAYAKQAANDDDWIVREYAAAIFAKLLQKDFSHFSKLFLKWVKSESTNIKRAIALAIKYDASSVETKKLKIYLALIEPLMSEEAEYIRKNVGPFAIGDGLLSRFPGAIIKSCHAWIRSENEYVRWNTAMIFTAAAARKFAPEAKPILQKLAKDEVPLVSRAAKRALKNIEGQ